MEGLSSYLACCPHNLPRFSLHTPPGPGPSGRGRGPAGDHHSGRKAARHCSMLIKGNTHH